MFIGLEAYGWVEHELVYEILDSHHLRKALNIGKGVGDANQGFYLQISCSQSIQCFFKAIPRARKRMQTLQERKELLDDTELDWVQEDYQQEKGALVLVLLSLFQLLLWKQNQKTYRLTAMCNIEKHFHVCKALTAELNNEGFVCNQLVRVLKNSCITDNSAFVQKLGRPHDQVSQDRWWQG